MTYGFATLTYYCDLLSALCSDSERFIRAVQKRVQDGQALMLAPATTFLHAGPERRRVEIEQNHNNQATILRVCDTTAVVRFGDLRIDQ